MLVLSDYKSFVADLNTSGSYSGFLSILALSSVIVKPIQTVWPIDVSAGQQPPYSKLIAGRGVTSCKHPLFVLWTTCRYEGCLPVDINHIVPLCESRVSGMRLATPQ